MVIGLEYILDLYSMTGTELADDLKIKKQNISRWFKGVRKIPVKYLDILEDKFKIPKEYITKNVRESDKLIIQKYKIENEDNEKKQLYQLEYDIKRYKILEKIEDLIFNNKNSYLNTEFTLELHEDLINEKNSKIVINIFNK